MTDIHEQVAAIRAKVAEEEAEREADRAAEEARVQEMSAERLNASLSADRLLKQLLLPSPTRSASYFISLKPRLTPSTQLILRLRTSSSQVRAKRRATRRLRARRPSTLTSRWFPSSPSSTKGGEP